MVTNRCFQAQFVLRPDPETNRLILLWLQRAARIYDVQVIAYCFMSNHFHIIVRLKKPNLSAFMAYFQRNLARALNLHRKRYDSVFPKRFHSLPILDHGGLLKEIAYVLLNPVKASQVAHPDQWPGVISWGKHMGEQGHDDIELVAPPKWADLDADQLAEAFRTLIKRDLDDLQYVRKRVGGKRTRRRFTGAKKVLARAWWRRPKKPKRGRAARAAPPERRPRTSKRGAPT
jgi:REP element-mobilizing transposase RayT